MEIEQFGKPEAGRKAFVTALQHARVSNTTGCPVIEWADAAGISKPTLVFDLPTIRERMRWLVETAGSFSIIPLLAVKSCTEEPYLEAAQQYLGGYDVSNLKEYSALPENLQGRLVSVTSPSLTDHLARFRSRGNELVVTLDSQVQLDQFFTQSQPCEYVLRIRGGDLLQGTLPVDPAYYPVTRFGFSLDEVQELLRDPRVKAKPPAGFHVHHGSEMNRLSTFRALIGGLENLARILEKPVKYLNLGGGWHCLAFADFTDIFETARRHFPHPCSILLEPGRWYAESAGFAIGTIVNLSRDRDIVRCTLDLSARCHLHWSRPRLLHFTEPCHEQGGIVQFFGASCYESDFIGKYYLPYSADFLKDTGLGYGKRIIFSNVSTYSAEWNTSFNGIPKANVEWTNL